VNVATWQLHVQHLMDRIASVIEPFPQPDNDAEDRRPTLKTIAFMTGLGVTTVSRALKDAPDIGIETKKRVRLVANQVGYRPNRAGVRLRTGKTNVISLVLDTGESASGFLSALIYGISSRIVGTPYHLVVTPSLPGQDPMEPIRYIVETGSADGIIMSRTEPFDRRVQYLMERAIPFASHGRTLFAEPHPFVDYDNTSFGQIAVEKLAACGRKRIGMIGPPVGLSYHQHMWQGFGLGLESAGLREHPIRGIEFDSPPDAVFNAARQVAARSDFPDGIVAASGAIGLAWVAGYEETGRILGKDFDIVTKETVPLQRFVKRAMMTIPEDFGQAGALLADAVLRAIDGENPLELQTIIKP
jgi:LacI family transcriptional regulator